MQDYYGFGTKEVFSPATGYPPENKFSEYEKKRPSSLPREGRPLKHIAECRE